MRHKSFTKEQIANDCLVILNWFDSERKTGNKISVRRCARDTGIPRSMLRKYIEGYKKWAVGEYKCWFLGEVAHWFSYEIKYINNDSKLWVRRKHNVDNMHYFSNEINFENPVYTPPLVGLY